MKENNFRSGGDVKLSGTYIQDIYTHFKPLEPRHVDREDYRLERWNVGEGADVKSVLIVEQVGYPGTRIQIEPCINMKDLINKKRRAIGMNIPAYDVHGDSSFIGLHINRRYTPKAFTPEMAEEEVHLLHDAARWYHLYGKDEVIK